MKRTASTSESLGALKSSRMNVVPSSNSTGLICRSNGSIEPSARDASSTGTPSATATPSAASADPRPCSPKSRVCTWRRGAYWQALDDAVDERDGKQRLRGLVAELDGAGYTAAAKCLADDLDAPRRAPALPDKTAADGAARTCSNARSPRSNAAPR
jgi:hypothetical protein